MVSVVRPLESTLNSFGGYAVKANNNYYKGLLPIPGVSLYPLLGASLLSLLLLWANLAAAQDVRHRTHRGGTTTIHEITYPSGRTYYNFDVYMTPKNTSLEMIESKGRARSNPINEGYFEVYMDKADLPITARSCKGDKAIIAMPWGGKDPKSKKNKQRVELYNRVRRLLRRGQGRIRVVLESIPDQTKGLVAPVRSSPIRQLDLSSCTLYFRTSRGAVVNYPGLLSSQK